MISVSAMCALSVQRLSADQEPVYLPDSSVCVLFFFHSFYSCRLIKCNPSLANAVKTGSIDRLSPLMMTGKPWLPIQWQEHPSARSEPRFLIISSSLVCKVFIFYFLLIQQQPEGFLCAVFWFVIMWLGHGCAALLPGKTIPVLKSIQDGEQAVLLPLILSHFAACIWLTVAGVVRGVDQIFGNRLNAFNTY